jgi:hypothetical protein
MAMDESGYPGQQPADDPQWPDRYITPIDPGLPFSPSQLRPWRSPPDRPVQVRLVRNGWTGAIEGVRIRNPDRPTDTIVRPTGSLAAEVRQAFADFLAEAIVDAVWPVLSAGMRPPASSSEMLSLAEELLDPRLLAGELARAVVQVAAVHAGIPLPVARLMGKAAQDLLVSLLSPDPDARKVEAVQYADLTLSAVDGSLMNSPALLERVTGEIADVINELLDPGGRPRPPLRPPRPDVTGVPLAKPHDTGAPPAPPPGWHTVPGTTTKRWWDGAAWTDRRPPPPADPTPGGDGPSPISL